MKTSTKKELENYFHLLFYILLFNTAMITVTVVLHEGGHYIAGTYLGCQNANIILLDSQTMSTYTEMNCPPDVPLLPLLLSGFLLVIPFSLSFLILWGFPEKYFCWVIIGFNIIISISDIVLITDSFVFLFTLILGGFAMIVYGETLLINKFLIFIEQRKMVK